MRRLAVFLLVLAVLGLVWLGSDRSPEGDKAPDRRNGRKAQSAAVEGDLPGGFSEEVLARLEDWLTTEPAVQPAFPTRDIFRKASTPDRIVSGPVSAPEPRTEAVLPRLTGFVLEGPQRGPVAAIRYEGRMWLVAVNDTMGPYRVEKLIAGEEVLLVEVESGEEILLTLN